MIPHIDTLSAKQIELINHANSEEHLFLAGGSIRSGKTFSAVIAFAVWSLFNYPGYRFVLSGVSVDSIRRNYADEMVEFMRSLGFDAKYRMTPALQIVVPQVRGTPSVYHLVGASDRTAAGRLQGLTIAGALLDEIVLLPRDFVFQLLGRQSIPGGKIWGTFNPANPAHWLKREIVDKKKKFNCKVLKFTFEDNPSLSDEVKQRYRNSFSGHWRRRFVDGDWSAPSGAIFPYFTTTDTDFDYSTNFSLGLDWAVSGIFAALLFGRRAGPTGGIQVCDEFIHNARESDIKTEEMLIVEMRNWLGDRQVRSTYVDPSTPATFKRRLRNAGFGTVHNADNDVNAGIMTTSTRLANKNIVINKRCTYLLDEIESYQWDPDKADIGEDAPIKSADHTVDALRYFAHSTGKTAYQQSPGRKPKGM